jgi:hypothetical protein
VRRPELIEELTLSAEEQRCWMNSRLNAQELMGYSNMSNIIAKLESEGLDKKIPDFSPGDTVVVEVKVKEGDRERVQAYEGSSSRVAIVASTPRSPCARFPTVKASSACFRRTARRSARSRQASRQRASGQALLPARSDGQSRSHRRKGVTRCQAEA